MFVDPDGRTNYWYDSKGDLIKTTWALFTFYFYKHEKGNIKMNGRTFYRCNSHETIFGPEKEQRPINNVDITFQSKEFLDRLEASKPEGTMGLIETYEWIYDQSISGVMDQKGNLDKNTLYLFNNTLFNSNEAGNIVWGARMYKFGFNLWYAKDLAGSVKNLV